MPELLAVPEPDDGPELPAGPFDGTDSALGLTLPKLHIVPGTGPAYEVQAYNPDMLLFEETAAKHRWQGPAEAPFRWLTFLAWAASVRTGRTDLSWDAFRKTTLEVRNIEGRPATPTRPGVAPG